MKAFKIQAFVIIGTLLSLTLLSCSGGGGGVGGGGGGGGNSVTIIAGHVADGFVAGATVTAYQVNADGTQGAQIGTPVLTDQSGNYTLNLGTYSGPVLITSAGGTYTDTVTGTTIDLTNSPLILSSIVPNASGNVTVQINPLTTMAADVALTLVGQGIPVVTAADAANASVQDYFALTLPILDIALVNLTTTGCMTGENQASADASAILAGISQLAFNNGVSSLDLIEALIRDVTSDGIFDGLASGATISVPLTSGTGTIPLSTIEGTALTGLANAITTFMTSTSNICGATVDSSVISALSYTNIFTTPDAPTGVTATAGAGSVIMSWDTVTTATSYNLYMANSTGVTATSTQLPGYRSIPNVTSPYDISSGLTTSTTYYFVVTAVSGTSPYVGSESAASAEVSATVLATGPGLPQWAQTVTGGSDQSVFSSVTVTSDGSVYAAGSIDGTGAYNFGNNVTAAGTYSGGKNIVLVKYNSSGVAQWAQTVTGGSNQSVFSSVSVAPDGSVYAAGSIYGTGAYNFGNSVTAAGMVNGDNIVLVKYNSSGAAQWAQTVTGGSDQSSFSSVSVASDGSVYAAGYIEGAGAYNFGNGVTATGTYSGGNMVLVKYDSSGAAQWAQTVTTGSSDSNFFSVSAGLDGSVYAAGYIYGLGTFTFGNSVTAAGTVNSENIVLVKYNSSGTAQWAQTVTAGSNQSSFRGVSVASDGSVYAAGDISGTGTFNFGNSVTATGTYTGGNIVLLKYAALFTPIITATAGPNGSISPAGPTPVTYNGSQTFTITANTDYLIASVLVDGVSISGQSNTTFSYTFTNVTANHTISATFVANTGSGGGTGF